jgi:hypothetical protein
VRSSEVRSSAEGRPGGDGILATCRRAGVQGLHELIVLVALIFFIEMAIPGSASLAQISPHPLWIPVLLLSVQYGTASGVAAAATATALSWAMGWPTQTSGEDFYAYSLRIWKEPMLWFAAAIILGALRRQQIVERDGLADRLKQSLTQTETIAERFDRLQLHCADVELRIACARDGSIGTALSALAELRNGKSDDIASRLAHAVDLMLGSARYSVLAWREGSLVMLDELGHGAQRWPGVMREPDLETACERALISSHGTLSVLNDEGARLLNGVGLIAVPISGRDWDKPSGIFIVEQIEAARLNLESVLAADAICASLSHAMASRVVKLTLASDQERVPTRRRLPDKIRPAPLASVPAR